MGVAVPKPHFKRRVPKRFNRGKFSKETRERIFDRDEGLCRSCGALGHLEIHHVYLKSQGGRGVTSNGMLVCASCHSEIHQNNKLKEFWQEVFKKEFGSGYFKDEWDFIRGD
jgi:5-methylcytosine-specific restriction endonuclease McrA